MRSFLSFLYLAHAVLAGDLFTPQVYSPVGVGYSAAPVFPQPVAPLHYASPLRTSIGYGPLAAARFNQITPYAAPGPFIAPASIAAPAPVAVPAASYAPVVKQYAAVPAVADVPITRYEATPGFIQKYLDVAHPKVATTKIQIRRPAIQKQFYDIEERIVVRPVASAVVELDQPLSKSQAGPTLISHAVPAYPPVAPVPISSPVPVPPLPPTPAFTPAAPPSNPPPSLGSPNPFPSEVTSDNEDTSDDSDSITVDNEDFRARSRSQEMPQMSQPQPQQQPEPQPEERRQQEQQQPREQPQARMSLPQAQQPELQTQARFLSRSQMPQFNDFIPQTRAFQIPDVIPSSRTSLTEDQSQTNQQRLIELLTSRGGVEVRSGVSVESSGEAGQIRGRVLSVTPAPQTSGPADERVSTRRVVVSRPIQTLQEIDVVQPFTKVHRLSVQQPALLKTQRIDIARVKTLAPVPVTSYGAPYGYLH